MAIPLQFAKKGTIKKKKPFALGKIASAAEDKASGNKKPAKWSPKEAQQEAIWKVMAKHKKSGGK
jgi:hypothetical protein